MKIYVLWPCQDDDEPPVMYAKTLEAGVQKLIKDSVQYVDNTRFIDACESDDFKNLSMSNIHDLMDCHPEFTSDNYGWEEAELVI